MMTRSTFALVALLALSACAMPECDPYRDRLTCQSDGTREPNPARDIRFGF